MNFPWTPWLGVPGKWGTRPPQRMGLAAWLGYDTVDGPAKSELHQLIGGLFMFIYPISDRVSWMVSTILFVVYRISLAHPQYDWYIDMTIYVFFFLSFCGALLVSWKLKKRPWRRENAAAESDMLNAGHHDGAAYDSHWYYSHYH